MRRRCCEVADDSRQHSTQVLGTAGSPVLLSCRQGQAGRCCAVAGDSRPVGAAQLPAVRPVLPVLAQLQVTAGRLVLCCEVLGIGMPPDAAHSCRRWQVAQYAGAGDGRQAGAA